MKFLFVDGAINYASYSRQHQFFGSSVNIRRWTYVSYCRSAMAQKLFSTGPGIFRRAERKSDNRWFGTCYRAIRSNACCKQNNSCYLRLSYCKLQPTFYVVRTKRVSAMLDSDRIVMSVKYNNPLMFYLRGLFIQPIYAYQFSACWSLSKRLLYS